MKRIAATAVRALCLLAMVGAVQAQEWAPTKPVRIIVPIIGSTNDVLARMVAPKLQDAIGQPVVVENKPGGRWQHRCRLRCQVRARRPHPADRLQRPDRDQPDAVRQDAL